MSGLAELLASNNSSLDATREALGAHAKELRTATAAMTILREYPRGFQSPHSPVNSTTASSIIAKDKSTVPDVETSVLPLILHKRKEPDRDGPSENLANTDPTELVKMSELAASSGNTTMPAPAKPTHPNTVSAPPSPAKIAQSSSTGAVGQTEPILSDLTKLLPLPAETNPLVHQLTRSQRLFLHGTGTNPKALEISKGQEFFVFMEMRKDLQWKASNMTSRKWAEAVGLCNTRLSATVPTAVPKSPRALMEKLDEIEHTILKRIAINDFQSQRGSKIFWTKHCLAVPLAKLEPTVIQGPAKVDKAVTRKIAVCTRCNKIMYPGPEKAPENHKKGCCSDGFKQRYANGELLPPWPQPAGIFTNASEFHPFAFLANIRDLYEKVGVEGGGSNISIEGEAFPRLQMPGRIATVDGAVLFKLFEGFTIPAEDRVPDTLFVEHGGARYLRIDALSDTHVSE
ncbi:hypothetical protein B0H11DRAFT_2015631 [Mycena galericulata]|nr:hypothetical protein B0H11DRAFT_2015631 [Mycena galericulata]